MFKEISGHNQSKILVFPSSTSYILTSFSFPSLIDLVDFINFSKLVGNFLKFLNLIQFFLKLNRFIFNYCSGWISLFLDWFQFSNLYHALATHNLSLSSSLQVCWANNEQGELTPSYKQTS